MDASQAFMVSMFKPSSLAVLIVVFGSVFASVRSATAPPVSGTARVIDGDTIQIGSERIRMEGIDAPESTQTCRDGQGRTWACGEAATRRLRRFVDGVTVSCESSGRDDYGRLIGTCRTPERDLGATLVSEGLAWAFVKYSTTYVAQERAAREAKRGVFAAQNVTPWDFRAGRWGASLGDGARECPIKGNITARGEKIYHMPWQRDYHRVRIDERKGEAWFCDEGRAARAGWRRAAR
jgi:endonuclease YncB( thermonuclease family)